MKRRLLPFFSIILTLTFATTVSANPLASENTVLYNVGKTIPEITSDDLDTYATSKPSKENIWNIKTKGQYPFSGNATGSTLYTNYWLTGKTSYTVYTINNHSSKALKITPVSSTGGIFKGTTVPANARQQYTFSVNKTSEKIYLKFSAPSDFDGYIK